MRLHVHMYMCVIACGGLEWTSRIILDPLSSLLSGSLSEIQSLPINFPSQLALACSAFLGFKCWVHPAFMWVLGIWPLISSLVQEVLHHWAVSLAQILFYCVGLNVVLAVMSHCLCYHGSSLSFLIRDHNSSHFIKTDVAFLDTSQLHMLARNSLSTCPPPSKINE